MHKHGTPAFDKKLFNLIAKNLNVNFFVAYKDNIAIASLILLEDEEIAIVPWASSDNRFLEYCPNNLIYFEAIKFAISNKRKIFDFGRSNYGGSTYTFKKQWGAEALKIDILQPNKENIYNKYSLASKIWQKLPKVISDPLGTKLCKYLKDL